jgi:hypothetical protein
MAHPPPRHDDLVPADGAGGRGLARRRAGNDGRTVSVVVFRTAAAAPPPIRSSRSTWRRGVRRRSPPHPGNTSEDCTVCDSANIVAARERLAT